ncbi:MAG: branched-chain amino acid transaminase [Deltaproteobacteria bacterium]|nr:branched-chain amino acid transaminase [Deltaproteobacteria bacterium]
MTSDQKIWFDGELVDFEAANTHFLSHSLHYGLGAFEGIRAYKTSDGRTAVFRLPEHMRRLIDSCRCATIEAPYSVPQLVEATLQVVRANQLAACYIRPLVWLGRGTIKVGGHDNIIHTAIAAWTWGAYLGDKALTEGVQCTISSFTRMGIGSHLEKAKITGQYTNSVLAKRDANMKGFDEAILLDAQGYVSEGSGENIFVVRDGIVRTPPRGASILAGLTRDSVMQLLSASGVEVREEMITRSELFMADEVFFTGTAAEITPVRAVDGRKIGAGARGPITEKAQSLYLSAVRGERAERNESWLTYV